jgi:hypothetical protein
LSRYQAEHPRMYGSIGSLTLTTHLARIRGLFSENET